MVSRLSSQHPNLVRLAQHLQQPSVDCNAAVIEFNEGGCGMQRLYKKDQIEQVLDTKTPSIGRLFLVQGLSTGSIEALGAHFNIDPNFFARQMQSGILYESNGMRDIPLLASHPTSRESFCIRYHELRQFEDGISSWELQIMDQPRRVSVSRFNGEFDGVGIVRKNVSLWYRARLEGKGWNGRWDGPQGRSLCFSAAADFILVAIILLDPPVGSRFLVGAGKTPRIMHSSLYRGGYVDFHPTPTSLQVEEAATSPQLTRESALDDLLYYYTTAEPPSTHDYTSPVTISGVLKRYVASHWMVQLQYSLDLLLKYENTYHRACFFASVSSTLIQNALRDVQHLNDRVACWCDQVDRSIDQFKACGTLGSFPGQPGNDEAQDDFSHLLHQLQRLNARAQTVIASMTGLISIIETMRMKELSLLAMIFIPLSLVSGIFSMQGDFAPGKSSFWMYCVAGFSLVAVVFAVAFGLHPLTTLIKMFNLERMAGKKTASLKYPGRNSSETV
jgi:hypothetical protein